jgi:hypothetical protein
MSDVIEHATHRRGLAAVLEGDRAALQRRLRRHEAELETFQRNPPANPVERRAESVRLREQQRELEQQAQTLGVVVRRLAQ